VQVVIALIVTPQGFPLAYEVLAGNTSDSTTLREFLQKIETQYGKAERIWLWIGGFRPKPYSKKCARASRRSSIW
jgi:transposase